MDDAASKALQKTMEKSSLPRVAADGYLVKTLIIFSNTVRVNKPDWYFTVQDIAEWLSNYHNVSGEEPPQLFSTKSLGKYIGQNPKLYGLQLVDTYGNRKVYSVLSHIGEDE